MLRPAPVTQSIVHIKRLQAFKNKGIIDDITPNEVYKNHDKIYEEIQKYDNFETKRSYLQSLIDCLKRQHKPDMDIIIKYTSEAYELAKTVRYEYSLNRPLKNRAHYTYNQLCSLMGQIENEFNTQDFTTQKHNLLIILNMNLRQPPLRTEITDMLFVDSPDYMFEKDKNYLVKTDDGYHYLLYKYKTKGFYNDKKIKIQNKELVNFLNRSFKKTPRKYLLGIDKPMGYFNYRNCIRWGLGPGISTDGFRSIYITEFMSKNPSFKAKQELADSMGHSVMAQQLYYNKVKNGENTVFLIPKQDEEPDTTIDI